MLSYLDLAAIDSRLHSPSLPTILTSEESSSSFTFSDSYSNQLGNYKQFIRNHSFLQLLVGPFIIITYNEPLLHIMRSSIFIQYAFFQSVSDWTVKDSKIKM